MATMPARSPAGQPDAARHPRIEWFGSAAGQWLLQSESGAAQGVLSEARGLPWLWLEPLRDASGASGPGRGLRLAPTGDGLWHGEVRCGPELPLASESIGAIVLQHVLRRDSSDAALLEECTRVLVPGGRLGLFALNPLAPYRWRWRGAGLRPAEPLVWRRRLREAGLAPEPLSQGIGPSWREAVSASLQQGVGLRAAYLLRAEKRSLPLTPVRTRRRVGVGDGVPA